MVGVVVGRMDLDAAVCLIFAQAYTSPEMKPIMMADTLPRVIGASKKMRPLTAMGSLLRAPTIE